jgi:hypothetical protein
MNAKRWAIGVGLAILVANTGCVACCHKTHESAWINGAQYNLPTVCRSQVYVFMIHGLTPSTHCGLEALRLKLGEDGFPKVGMGELVHICWVESEIKSIAKCEPEARFVLVGYDLGACVAQKLARDLVSEGIPVESLVFLDPLGVSSKESCPIHTLLITSGTTVAPVPHHDRVVVPDVNHYQLPAHPTTVSAITELLKDIALRSYIPPVDTVQEWSYPHAPAMRPIPTMTTGKWNFLADQPTVPNAIGTRVEYQLPAATPVAGK